MVSDVWNGADLECLLKLSKLMKTYSKTLAKSESNSLSLDPDKSDTVLLGTRQRFHVQIKSYFIRTKNSINTLKRGQLGSASTACALSDMSGLRSTPKMPR
jgi:hypothetical protein